MNDGVIVSASGYEKDMQRLRWLDALEDAGVDNWEGMDEAIKIYNEMEGTND